MGGLWRLKADSRREEWPSPDRMSLSAFRIPHGNICQGSGKATIQAWVKGDGCRQRCQQHERGTANPSGLGEYGGDGGELRKGAQVATEGRLRCGLREWNLAGSTGQGRHAADQKPEHMCTEAL